MHFEIDSIRQLSGVLAYGYCSMASSYSELLIGRGLQGLSLGLGILCFSFSIYSKLLIADSFLSRLTPLGGLFFMVGWLSPLLCLIDLWRQARSSASPS